MKRRKLYERCEVCAGTLKTQAGAMIDGPKYTGPIPVGSPCPVCAESRTPGFVEVGVSARQLDRLVTLREKLGDWRFLWELLSNAAAKSPAVATADMLEDCAKALAAKATEIMGGKG